MNKKESTHLRGEMGAVAVGAGMKIWKPRGEVEFAVGDTVPRCNRRSPECGELFV